MTVEQWRRIEPRQTAFRRESQSLCLRIHGSRSELIDLVAAEEPDRQAIEAKLEEIRAGQRQMQQLIVEHLMAEKQVLTDEQERELFRLLHERSACSGPGRMMGLGPPSNARPVDER
ncbi:Spy/CpxP family protein refolding chaperone [Planctomycetota bacterium]